MNLNQIENFLTQFLEIGTDHPKFNWAVSKIKELLGSANGQEAFQTVFSAALSMPNLIHSKEIKYKLSLFLPLLNSENKIELIEWLPPQYIKHYLNDPDEKIQEIAQKILGIQPDKLNMNYLSQFQDKEIGDSVKTREPSVEPTLKIDPNKKSIDKIVDDFHLQFGKRNTKLNHFISELSKSASIYYGMCLK